MMAGHSEPRSELSWTAFRYVAGELSADAATAFEARLEADQEAREAVAQAVELSGAVRLVAPDLLPSRLASRARWTYALAGVAAGMAACLTLWLLPYALITGASREGAEIALAWSDLRRDQEDDWLDESTATDEPEASTIAEEEDELPSWLLEVVSLPSTEPADDTLLEPVQGR